MKMSNTSKLLLVAVTIMVIGMIVPNLIAKCVLYISSTLVDVFAFIALIKEFRNKKGGKQNG